MSTTSLLLSLASVAVYGYSAYYMSFDENCKHMKSIIPKELHKYGNFKYLTFQCLLIQLFSATLHVAAHFVSSLRPLRDLVFSSLAYPIGSFVVLTFWTVWHVMGRQFIFPIELEQFYPSWLNHSTHSIILFVNLLFVFIEPHKYSKKAPFVTLIYFLFYLAVLFYIKIDSGRFVYPYLEALDNFQLVIYFSVSTVLALLLYWKGKLLNACLHQSASSKSIGSNKSKRN